jgi:hypothetical protein
MIIPVVASPWKPGVVCTIILLLLASISTLFALDRTLVPVAAYSNQPEIREKHGKWSITLLNDRKIINFLGDRLFNDSAWAQWKRKLRRLRILCSGINRQRRDASWRRQSRRITGHAKE